MIAPNQNPSLGGWGLSNSGPLSSAPFSCPLEALEGSHLPKEPFFSHWQYKGLARLPVHPCHWFAEVTHSGSQGLPLY